MGHFSTETRQDLLPAWPLQKTITHSRRKISRDISTYLTTYLGSCPLHLATIWKILNIFLIHSRSLFRLFNTADRIGIKIFWWLDSNRGPLVSEATALPTAPQPLPTFSHSLFICTYNYKNYCLCLKLEYNNCVELLFSHSSFRD